MILHIQRKILLLNYSILSFWNKRYVKDYVVVSQSVLVKVLVITEWVTIYITKKISRVYHFGSKLW